MALLARAGHALPTYQDREGKVTRVSRGPRPINAEVRFADGSVVVVPRGNLVLLPKDKWPRPKDRGDRP